MEGALLMEPCGVWIGYDGIAIIIACLLFVLVVQIWNGLKIYKLEKLMSNLNQGLNDLNTEVAAETAEAQAEVAAFNELAAAIQQLVAAGPGEVSDAQLESLSQTLASARTARQAAAAAAVAVIPSPAPPPASDAPALAAAPRNTQKLE